LLSHSAPAFLVIFSLNSRAVLEQPQLLFTAAKRFYVIRITPNCVELVLVEQNLAVTEPMARWYLSVLSPSPERLTTDAGVAKDFIYREIQPIVYRDWHASGTSRYMMLQGESMGRSEDPADQSGVDSPLGFDLLGLARKSNAG
jgi:hypothetical protein